MTAKKALRAAATVVLALVVLPFVLFSACEAPEPSPTPGPIHPHTRTASDPAGPLVTPPAPRATAVGQTARTAVSATPVTRASTWETVRRCIVFHESRGIPTAVNRSGVPSYGLYQFIDATWHRYGGYLHASQAPVAVQTARFWQVWDHGLGRSNWLADRACW